MTAKKIFTVLLISLGIYLLIVPFVSYKAFKLAIRNEVFNHLITTRDLLKHQIRSYFQERYGDIDVLSRNPVIAQGFTRLSSAFSAYGIESNEFLRISDLYQPLMEYYVSDYGYANILFVDKDGNVMFSVAKEDFFGTNLLTGRYKHFSIAHIFKRGLEEVNFEDYTWHDGLNEFTSYYAAPVYDAEKLLGTLIIEIPFSHLDTMLTQRSGLGQTGEMYLVGEDSFMRSNSRFVEEPTILKVEVDTEAVREALSGYVGAKIIKDYRNVSVLSAYTPLNLRFVNWALLVEIDKAEAFAPIILVQWRLYIIGAIIGSIAFAYLYFTRGKEDEQDTSELAEGPES